MASLLARSLLCLAFILVSYGSSFDSNPCGDWVAFKNEKCVKLVDRSGMQNKENAEIICKTLGEEIHSEDVPKLVTVKTEEKQKFLQKLLFEELESLDTVWLGLDSGNDSVYRWSDGSELHYTNWAEDYNVARERNCVQMESGDGHYETGKWTKASCKKRNAVVCEKTQPWTVITLQNILLNLKLEMEKNKQELEKTKQQLEKTKQELQKDIQETKNETAKLKGNPVPVGFIYVQLASQQPPTTLWPQTNWTDVTSTYAGLFFRAAGGSAAPFGAIQEESTSRLEQIEAYQGYNALPAGGCGGGIQTPSANGAWTPYIFSGRDTGSTTLCWRFRLTGKETRPRNQAIQIWKRNA